MKLIEQINQNFISALKSKDKIKVSTLRMLKSQIQNKEIETGKELTDNDVIEVISKQIKQRNGSIKEYKTGNREDLVKKEQQEIEVLKPYLPQQISDDEISKIVDDTIKKTNASTMTDMGKVMEQVLAKTKGRADNSKIAQMVKSQLQG